MSLAHKLGLPEDAKIVVAHQDDVGMCHGANAAFADLADLGFITCTSVMVPCPWFLEVAEMAARRPD
jgi:chitin disaccharide deacetylase